MTGRLPDPGMGAICGRCGEPRLAHGGPKRMGACPGETGLQAKRFSIAPDDRPQPGEPPRERLPLPAAATGMGDLATWLRAQLAEDEREINRHPDGNDDFLGGDLVATEEQNYPAAPYLAMSKTRALAELDAKRRILDHVERELSDPGGDNPYWYEDKMSSVLRLLALPYADRPGYREEWRP